MVASTAQRATANARAQLRCSLGLCLHYTRSWLEIGPRDNWAITAFHNAEKKHAGDRTPPRGAPVFWEGGSHGYGHIALALLPANGVARIRTTDVPGGTVATVPLSYIEEHWGFKYLGWAEDLNGVDIPYLGATTVADWAGGDVWVSKLHSGQGDSDSVRRLQYRLQNLVAKGGTESQTITGSYMPRTVVSVMAWQVANPDAQGPTDGHSVSMQQAQKLFGDNYTLHQ